MRTLALAIATAVWISSASCMTTPASFPACITVDDPLIDTAPLVEAVDIINSIAEREVFYFDDDCMNHVKYNPDLGHYAMATFNRVPFTVTVSAVNIPTVTYLHELGHVLGLNHSQGDSHCIMQACVNPNKEVCASASDYDIEACGYADLVYHAVNE